MAGGTDDAIAEILRVTYDTENDRPFDSEIIQLMLALSHIPENTVCSRAKRAAPRRFWGSLFLRPHSRWKQESRR